MLITENRSSSNLVSQAVIPKPEKLPGDILAPRIVTFGEMLIRLSPPPGIRLEQASNFDLNFGGAEANVAVASSRFGLNVSFVTVLPDNDLGDNAYSVLKKHGVDTRFIIRKGDKMGIYDFNFDVIIMAQVVNH